MVEENLATRCILCQEPIPELTKPEHVLLNALGGRLTVRKIICPDCNQAMGNGPDKDLAKSIAFLRNVCHLKAGDGDLAPMLRGFEIDGVRFDLKPGMQPKIRPDKALAVDVSDREIKVKIEAYSDEDADKLAQGAATKIAKQLGHNTPQIIEAIKKDILKDKKSSFRPAPYINQELQFGTGRSQKAMAKACLVLWAKEVANTEVNSERYDKIRAFIISGAKGDDPEKLVKIDTRPLSAVIEYGTNPNLIWAGSDENGHVWGYYRLYNAMGWRFSLCERDAPPSQQVCLVSNPFNNRQWKTFLGQDSPVSYEWVNAQWESWPPQFDAVQSKMASMIEYAQELSQKDWLSQLVQEGLVRAGCREGEKITLEHITAFSEYVGRAISASVLKTEIPEN